MIEGDSEKRNTWAKVIQRRGEIGYPYIFFKDNANEGAPEVYKKSNYKINASNLCTEIMLPPMIIGLLCVFFITKFIAL